MEQLISNYESKIKSSIEKKEEYEDAVNGLEKKIEGLNKKLDDMLNEEDKESKKNKKNDSKKSKDENKKEKNREGRGGDKSDEEKEVAFIYSCLFPFIGSFEWVERGFTFKKVNNYALIHRKYTENSGFEVGFRQKKRYRRKTRHRLVYHAQ